MRTNLNTSITLKLGLTVTCSLSCSCGQTMSDSTGGNKRTDLLTILNKSTIDDWTSLECFGAAGEWSMVSFVACCSAELLCPDERCSGNIYIQTLVSPSFHCCFSVEKPEWLSNDLTSTIRVPEKQATTRGKINDLDPNPNPTVRNETCRRWQDSGCGFGLVRTLWRGSVYAAALRADTCSLIFTPSL